jgi:hypothetical protein
MMRTSDLATAIMQRVASALSYLSRDFYGLPITMTGATGVAAAGTTVLSITAPTDCYVRGLTGTILITASGNATTTGRLDRIDVAGFQIWDCQTATDPILAPITGAAGAGGASAQFSPAQTLGYPKGFKLRQGDTMQFTFVNNGAAACTGSVLIDAYRVDQIKPA